MQQYSFMLAPWRTLTLVVHQTSFQLFCRVTRIRVVFVVRRTLAVDGLFALKSQGDIPASCSVGGTDTKRPIASEGVGGRYFAGVGPTEGRILGKAQNRR